MRRVLILGAAGRDFHDFNVIFRNNPEFQVVAFTATQIPDIAGRRYPAELAGSLYPDGIPILEEDRMEEIIRDEHVDVVVFAYSDVPYATLMHLASRAAAVNADFWLLGAERTQLVAKVPVVSICAVRTGCGKSPVSRRIATELRKQGWHPVAIRHPMPYGDLAAQRVQRYATLADLDRYECTIEEREEYEPHIVEGTTVYAGVDYEDILRQAECEGDVILWDGGNNDTPFYRPDLNIVVLDPHRAGHELGYYPGEVNFRSADVLIINKVDTADPDGIKTVRRNIALHNPKAQVIETACRVTVDDPEAISGKNVLVVEDGPTLTHGEMPYGAGVVAANRYHAAALIDPRPYAVGSIQKTFEKFPHLWRVLPAMGYSDTQRHELEQTIKRVPCDLVVVATPIDLARTITLDKPYLKVRYEVEELGKPAISEMIQQFTETHKPALVGAGR
ncbi:MAG TPA: cyclic 2,3-diphosphoglycerate synthase [Terriglobales bacterium]|jgi:predicted GTPase|nr:cyclic 2,3-diphosphoglycerate synthase [Terriglobales bacterium]